MSGAHEGCSQGKSVRDREGSKHSTAATLERVDSQAAVLPQAFKDRVHARQLAGVVQESGAKDESSRFGTLTFNMTHASERGAAARKSQRVTRIAGVEKFVGSRFTPTCNTSPTDWLVTRSVSKEKVVTSRRVSTTRKFSNFPWARENAGRTRSSSRPPSVPCRRRDRARSGLGPC